MISGVDNLKIVHISTVEFSLDLKVKDNQNLKH